MGAFAAMENDCTSRICKVRKSFAQTGQPGVQVAGKIFLHLQRMKKPLLIKTCRCTVCKTFAQTGQPAGGRKNLPAPAKDEKTIAYKNMQAHSLQNFCPDWTTCSTRGQKNLPAPASMKKNSSKQKSAAAKSKE